MSGTFDIGFRYPFEKLDDKVHSGCFFWNSQKCLHVLTQGMNDNLPPLCQTLLCPPNVALKQTLVYEIGQHQLLQEWQVSFHMQFGLHRSWCQ